VIKNPLKTKKKLTPNAPLLVNKYTDFTKNLVLIHGKRAKISFEKWSKNTEKAATKRHASKFGKYTVGNFSICESFKAYLSLILYQI
jgi:hypothetical protein